QMAKIHGNVFTLWLSNTPVVVLHGFQAVKEGLTVHADDVAGRPLYGAFRVLSHGKGVALSSGHLWKQQRHFGMATMRRMGVGRKDQECRLQEEACHLVEYLRNTNGKPLDPTVPLVHTVTNVICSVILGHRFSIDDENFHQLIECVDTIAAFLNSRSFYVSKTVGFVYTVQSVKGERRKGNEVQDWNSCKKCPVSFLLRCGFLMVEMEECERTKGDADATYDEDNLIQTIFDLFVAGTETTTTTLRWALLYTVVYPDVQEKVQKELDAVVGSSHLISYEDRKKLPYTNAVVHEIQRYSNIFLIAPPRMSMRDTELLGFPVPKLLICCSNTIVLPNLDSVLVDPGKWETPDQFNPGHFLDRDGNFINRDAFLPFSAG
ncbi:CP2J6 protein, partial [Bucorvus abyssinicus]|nr:CP2J6 protein [Bucorvus abyssinicus]